MYSISIDIYEFSSDFWEGMNWSPLLLQQDEADNLQDTVSALLTAKRSFSDHLALTRRIHDTINDVYSKRIAAKASTKP